MENRPICNFTHAFSCCHERAAVQRSCSLCNIYYYAHIRTTSLYGRLTPPPPPPLPVNSLELTHDLLHPHPPSPLSDFNVWSFYTLWSEMSSRHIETPMHAQCPRQWTPPWRKPAWNLKIGGKQSGAGRRVGLSVLVRNGTHVVLYIFNPKPQCLRVSQVHKWWQYP